MSQAQAKIRGIPSIPSIDEVNVRLVPGTHDIVAFKAPVGMDGLDILEVLPDVEGKNLNGKVYQWFKLVFHGGAVGYVRDDLIEVKGDLTEFDYPVLEEYTFAHTLTRGGDATAPQEPESQPDPTPQPPSEDPDPVPTPDPAPSPNEPTATGNFPDALADTDRVRKAAFLITGAFEGNQGYATYQNFDRGIVSYGFIQFTLGSGSLARVINLYLANTSEGVADDLAKYQGRINERDPMLRNDTRLRDLLIEAAEEPAMQQAQDQVATEGYWKSVVDGYIMHRGLRLPLTWALLFDMGVNFGVNHGFVRLAETQLGVPPRSRPGENGITEEQLMKRVAELRKQSHDNQAARDNLPGLARRGDFWMGLVNNNDWYLRGINGTVNANGSIINVLNPS